MVQIYSKTNAVFKNAEAGIFIYIPATIVIYTVNFYLFFLTYFNFLYANKNFPYPY